MGNKVTNAALVGLPAKNSHDKLVEHSGQSTIFDFVDDDIHSHTILLDFTSKKFDIASAMDEILERLHEPSYDYVSRCFTYSRSDLKKDALNLAIRALDFGVPVYLRNRHLAFSNFY